MKKKITRPRDCAKTPKSILSATLADLVWDAALVRAAEPLAVRHLAECGLQVGQGEELDTRLRAIVAAGRRALGNDSIEQEDAKLQAFDKLVSRLPKADQEAAGIALDNADSLAWSLASCYGDAAFYLGVAVGLRFGGVR